MSVFERYLTLWVGLAMLAGIAIGVMAPALVEAVAAAEVTRINLLVAVPIWAMIYPMMVRGISSATFFPQAVISAIRRVFPIPSKDCRRSGS